MSTELPRAIAEWFLDAGTASFGSPESVRMVVSHEFAGYPDLRHDVIDEIIEILTADEARRDT
jgi:hypothetical protein